ncbi:protein of unknown function [Ruminococcaceae bacterium BL-6]|nr:protein of unknown function [Ruminococcaceae bacterium BL-6]
MDSSCIYVVSKESECGWVSNSIDLVTTDFKLAIGFIYNQYSKHNTTYQLVLSVWNHNEKVLEYGKQLEDIICLDSEDGTGIIKEDYGTHSKDEIQKQVKEQIESCEIPLF